MILDANTVSDIQNPALPPLPPHTLNEIGRIDNYVFIIISITVNTDLHPDEFWMGDAPKVLRKLKDNIMLWGNTVIMEELSIQQISTKNG